jgi:hypothetical protein
LFYIKDFSTQEENLEILKQTLAVCKREVPLTSAEKFTEKYLIETHANFGRMIESMLFDEYLCKFTDKLEKAEPLEKVVSDEITESFDLLRHFANAATKPNVLEVVLKNLLS